MKRFFHATLRTVGAVIALLLAGFGYVWVNEWRPADEEVVYSNPEEAFPLPDTLTVLTWNTGYAGLGDDMDFFMDGGKGVRTSRERTEENLHRITEFLASCDADVILLQEVDRHSRRTYRTDQFAAYQKALSGYHGYFALNYKSPFVPVPLRAPVGRVEAGIAIFSKIKPQQVKRHQYKSAFPFPVRLFNLKYGWLVAAYPSGGAWVHIGVTHNTAYDAGGMRKIEQEQLYGWLAGTEGAALIGGDWNQTPPGYIPSVPEVENPYFSLPSIADDDRLSFAFDDSAPTVRYLYEPLTEKTTTSTIDFFITKGFVCEGVKVIDLGFKNSDHNPVVGVFVNAACRAH